mmetsp:Transcript_4747/g.15002  ORF Transcript_4747/g.15002 Transcript_4747/m.15002 type:complete len:201 (-) Transcript_4747:1611-2213(-)
MAACAAVSAAMVAATASATAAAVSAGVAVEVAEPRAGDAADVPALPSADDAASSAAAWRARMNSACRATACRASRIVPGGRWTPAAPAASGVSAVPGGGVSTRKLMSWLFPTARTSESMCENIRARSGLEPTSSSEPHRKFCHSSASRHEPVTTARLIWPASAAAVTSLSSARVSTSWCACAASAVATSHVWPPSVPEWA